MVNKQTGTIITAVLAVLFGCAAIFTCISGLMSASGTFQALRFGASAFGSGVFTRLGADVCMSLGFIALPVVFYIILVANNKDVPASPPESKDEPTK